MEVLMGIQYVHTNIIAKDWRALAQFYIQVFNCKQYGPERDLSGQWIEDMTGVKDVKVKGVHLTLPGYEKEPTLEIFSYEPQSEGMPSSINRIGLGHLAFHVDSVEETLDKLIAHGGKSYGKLIEKQYETLGKLTAIYATDPEGNLIEIQNWER